MSILERINRKKKQDSFDRRMSMLQEKHGYDVTLIATPTLEIAKKLENGIKSLVVYGEPQSGKTEFMIALVCKLLDTGRQTIFILMNDNTELEAQNFYRFKQASQINPAPISTGEFHQLEDKDKRTENKRVVFCRKNSSVLTKLIEDARFLKDRVIIDDEADYASPNTKVNKADYSTINKLVGKLGDLGSNGSGIYIGVTATPGRLDLNNTFQNEAKEWVFLEPHKGYKGRSFFFPLTEEEVKLSDYKLKRLPETGDDPRHLREAFLRYLVKNVILNLQNEQAANETCYSMLIHTDGKIDSHREDKKQIQEIISIIQNQSKKAESYFSYMQKAAEEFLEKYKIHLEVDRILEFILDNIGRNAILTLNSKNDRENVNAACNPVVLFTVAIGGNIVSRGLTFSNLISFFFSRGVTGKLQQNTYIQRARMFGNRPYSQYMEICVPETLFLDWANCFTDHEISVRAAKNQQPLHAYSDSNRPADSASIQRSTTVSSGSEMPAGEIFMLSETMEREFVNSKIEGINRIKDFINTGKLNINVFQPSLIQFIEDSFQQGNDVKYVTGTNSDGFLDISTTKDIDPETVSRPRGGLIAAMIKDRPIFEKASHVILCAKVGKKARFWYRNNLSKKILRNKMNSA
jgi:hypothetical protein